MPQKSLEVSKPQPRSQSGLITSGVPAGPSWRDAVITHLCKHCWSSHSHLHTDSIDTNVLHLRLVSLRLLASTDIWKAGGKMRQDPPSLSKNKRTESTKIPEKQSTCAVIKSVLRLERAVDRN